MHDKPVVALDLDGLYAPLRAQVELMVERGFVRPDAAAALRWASSVPEAFDLIEQELAHPVTIVPTVAEALESDPSAS